MIIKLNAIVAYLIAKVDFFILKDKAFIEIKKLLLSILPCF